MINGIGKEFDFQDNLVYYGNYCDSLRSGPGTLFFENGSFVKGVFDADRGGALHGEAKFYFPARPFSEPDACSSPKEEREKLKIEWADSVASANKCYYVGRWANGEMAEARYVDSSTRKGKTSYSFDPSPKIKLNRDEYDSLPNKDDDDEDRDEELDNEDSEDVDEEACDESVAREVENYKASRPARICRQPLLPDPYESEFVYVKNSLIAGANEGLFAKRKLLKGQVCAFYNGVKIPLWEVNRRNWSLNENTISLRGGYWVIDVPPHWSDCAKYCASLGHKANHCFEPSPEETNNSKEINNRNSSGTKNSSTLRRNAEYAPCFHPRFGSIKCVRAVVYIEKDDEILVDYGYDSKHQPKWYRVNQFDPSAKGEKV